MERSVKCKREKLYALRGENVVRAIGVPTRGMEVFGISLGQFSMIDIFEHLLKYAAPADCMVCTWTAGMPDLRRIHALMDSDKILDFRLLLDNSFWRRNKPYANELRRLYNSEIVRSVSVHAKMILISGGGWHFVVRTSMNLNYNLRMEQYEISDDPDLYAYVMDIYNVIWESQQPEEAWLLTEAQANKQAEKALMVSGFLLEAEGLPLEMEMEDLSL